MNEPSLRSILDDEPSLAVEPEEEEGTVTVSFAASVETSKYALC